MSEPGFLALRLGSLGDIVHTFPAVAMLRESFPRVQIVWLTHPRWQFLVQSSGLASEVWTVDSRQITSVWAALGRLRNSKFYAAIDYQGLFKSAALPFLGGVRKRIGFSSETVREYGVPLLYTERVRATSTHIADQNAELSLKAGARLGPGRVQLRVPPEDATAVRNNLSEHGVKEYFVLSPGGGWRAKCWPPDRFGQLAERIYSKLGLRSVINYGPGEADLAEAVCTNSGESYPLPFCGSLAQLMALLQSARGVIGGDTGPLHLADALRTPVVGIFGPTNPARNGIYFQKGVSLRAANVETTHKRLKAPHPSLFQISVDQVFEAVLRAGAYE